MTMAGTAPLAARAATAPTALEAPVAATLAAPLNPLELQFLRLLPALGPVPAGELPLRWPLLRLHLPPLLQRLEAAGLVVRLPGPDQRIALTPAGRAIR
jgi:DNA-binding MarR family transcriptional regulator